MSKRPHSQRGKPKPFPGWSVDFAHRNLPKKAQSYKHNVLNTYNNDVRKQTLTMEIRKAPLKGLGFVKHYTKQSKVRPVVQARLTKLKRYIDRSWRIGPKGVFDDLR